MGVPGEFGSALIGSLVSVMLYGITTLQTYVYYMHHSEDSSTTRFIVAATWVLDTLQVSFMCHAMYYYLITNWGVPTSLDSIVWSSPMSALVNSFVVTLVQLFFARQIYYLCRHQLRWLVIVSIIVLVLAYFGFSMGTVVIAFVTDEGPFPPSFAFHAAILSQAAGAVCEVLITTSLCKLLYGSSSGSAFPRTKRLLNTLLVYAVNRCLLTLFVVIAALAATVDNQDGWVMGLNFISGKLYANSLLSSLNTRQYLQSLGSGTKSDEPINTLHFTNLPKPARDVESSKDGVIGFSVAPSRAKSTALRKEGGV